VRGGREGDVQVGTKGERRRRKTEERMRKKREREREMREMEKIAGNMM